MDRDIADSLEAKGSKRIYPDLSPRQQRLLTLILRHRKRTQLCPTQAQLAQQMGIRIETLREHLARLEKKGRIVVYRGQARSIVVIRDH